MKSDIVVSVEANPLLCDLIRKRFSHEIKRGDLIVENVVLTNSDASANVQFYVHQKDHVLSQFPKPQGNLESYDVITLPSTNPVDLIRKYGAPHYIKIDIEHYDAEILRCLFKNDIYPPHISAECHSPEILSLLIAVGGYDAFNMVQGVSVSEIYKERIVQTISGSTQKYSFPFGSAGPYGVDIDGGWLNGACMLRKLGIFGCGWRDIHATKNIKKSSSYSIKKGLLDLVTAKGCHTLKKLFTKKS